MENRDIVYAGFWVRVLASVIDGLILTIPLSFIEVLFEENSTITLILFFIVWWFYISRMLSSSWKATIGKRVVSIEVTNENFEQLTFREANFRFLYALISYMLIIPLLMMLFSKKKQTLHDKMAKTIVLDSAEMSDGSTYNNVKFIRVIGYIILAILGVIQAYIMSMIVVFALLYSTQYTRDKYWNQEQSSHTQPIVIQNNDKQIEEYIQKEKLRIKKEEKVKSKQRIKNKKLMYKIREILVQKDRDLLKIKDLLKEVTNINMTFTDTSQTLLSTAVYHNDYNASKIILEYGANTNYSLSRALSDNTSVKLFNLVIGYYLNSTDFEKTRSILYKGIYKKAAPEKIEYILKYMEEINEKSQQHTSALGTAIKVCSSIETIKLLLSHGAKLNDDVKLVPLLRKSSYKCGYRKDIEEAMTPKPYIKQPVYKKLIRME